MHNRERGEVAIELDRPRFLRLKWNALAAFEKEMGQRWDVVINRVLRQGTQAKVLDVRNLLWAALLDDDPRLTPDAAGELMDYAQGEYPHEKLGSIMIYLLEAFKLINPPEEKKRIQIVIDSIVAERMEAAKEKPGPSGVASSSSPPQAGSPPRNSGSSPPASLPSTSMDSLCVSGQSAPSGQMR